MSSQDRTSHQVHIYGGHRAGDLEQKPSIDNHWILTIPGFIWIKAPSLATPRTLANCNLFGKSRMLISAGSLGAGEAGCLQTLDLVDLSTLEAVTSMNDDKPYQVPADVVSVIGGSYVPFPPCPHLISSFLANTITAQPVPQLSRPHLLGGPVVSTQSFRKLTYSVRHKIQPPHPALHIPPVPLLRSVPLLEG